MLKSYGYYGSGSTTLAINIIPDNDRIGQKLSLRFYSPCWSAWWEIACWVPFFLKNTTKVIYKAQEIFACVAFNED